MEKTAFSLLPAGVNGFLASEEGSTEYHNSLYIVSRQLEGSELTVIDLVGALGDVLTSTNEATRSRGTLLLAEVVDRSPTVALEDLKAHHLAVFFARRIADWPSLRPAMKGCLALVQPRDKSATCCRPADAVDIMRALLDVNVRSLNVGDRQLCLQLFLALVQGYGSHLVGSSLQLLEAAAAALDGERDPRCLLADFSIIQSLAELYAVTGEISGKVCTQELEEHAGDLVDVLGCYFPIVYTPPANTTGKITREELVRGVEQALSAVPAFAPHVIPMLLEKLSSSFRQAQEDALSLLAVSTPRYGATVMTQHLPKIWTALRSILSASGEFHLSADEKLQAQELATRAQACLRQCARSLAAQGHMQLVDLVLEDGMVRELLEDVADAGQRGGFAGAAGRTEATAPILTAVAGSSLQGSQRACQRLLGSLIRLISTSHSTDSRRLGLRAVLCLVSATRDCLAGASSNQQSPAASETCAPSVSQKGHAHPPASQQPGSTASAGSDNATLLAGKGSDVLRLALRTTEAAGANTASDPAAEQELKRRPISSMDSEGEEGKVAGTDAENEMDEDVAGDAEVRMLQLQVVAQLASFPRTSSPLSERDQQLALAELLSYVSTLPQAASMKDSLRVSPAKDSRGQPMSNVVCTALEDMARSGYENLLAAAALPRLLAAAGLPDVGSACAADPPHASQRAQSRPPAASSSGTAGAQEPEATKRSVIAEDVALRALASLAKASSMLRTPIMAAFVAGIPAALASAARQNGEVYSPLLVRLSDEQLLAGDADGSELVVIELLKGLDDLSQRSNGRVCGVALGDASLLAQTATSVCSGIKDSNIAHVVSTMILRSAKVCGTHTETAQVTAPAAAALAALPSSFAAGEGRLEVLRALLELVLGLPDKFAASMSATAAASVINKAPQEEVDMAVGLALDDTLRPCLAAGNAGCRLALMCIGQLGRALAMRGHARFQDVLEAALKLAVELAQQVPVDTSPSQRQVSEDRASGGLENTVTAADAAQVFADLLGSELNGAKLNAPGRIFAPGRVLWQQRAFTAATDLLLQEFGKAGQPEGAAPSTGAILSLERLLSAAGRGAPAAAVRAGYDRTLPAALTSLTALETSADVGDDGVAGALLQHVQQALSTPQGQELLEGELDRLVPLCARRATEAKRAACRAQAVATLEALIAYPYRLLHPFRPLVLGALSQAVDDRKRAVRAAAVRCRRRWGAQPV